MGIRANGDTASRYKQVIYFDNDHKSIDNLPIT